MLYYFYFRTIAAMQRRHLMNRETKPVRIKADPWIAALAISVLTLMLMLAVAGSI